NEECSPRVNPRITKARAATSQGVGEKRMTKKPFISRRINYPQGAKSKISEQSQVANKNTLSFHPAMHILRPGPMKFGSWLFGIAFFSLAACGSLESQGEFTTGRQALIKGDSSTALTYFQRVASADPNYVTTYTVFRESIWTYVGRAQYGAGKLTDARP